MYALLENIASFASKSRKAMNASGSLDDQFQDDFAQIQLGQAYSNAKKGVY